MRPNEKKERKKKKELASQVFHLFFGSIFRTEQTLALYLPTRVTARSISGSHVSPTIDQAFYVFFFFFFYYFPFLSIALRNNCYLDSTTVGEELFARYRDVRTCTQILEIATTSSISITEENLLTPVALFVAKTKRLDRKEVVDREGR